MTAQDTAALRAEAISWAAQHGLLVATEEAECGRPPPDMPSAPEFGNVQHLALLQNTLGSGSGFPPTMAQTTPPRPPPPREEKAWAVPRR